MLLSTLIWLLIHLLSLAIAFQRPLIGPFSLMKLEYWYFTVTSCPQRVTDPVTTRWCRGCELYLTGTFHFFSFIYLFFSMCATKLSVWNRNIWCMQKIPNWNASQWFLFLSAFPNFQPFGWNFNRASWLSWLDDLKMLISMFCCTSRSAFSWIKGGQWVLNQQTWSQGVHW